MLDYLVRFAQVHEGFRLPEIKAIADLYKIKLKVIHYSDHSPFAVIRLPDGGNINQIISRAILVQTVYELWGSGIDYPSLHESTKVTAADVYPKYAQSSFRFDFDSFRGSKDTATQRQIIEDFNYLGLQGLITMKESDVSFVIFEEYADPNGFPHAERMARRLPGAKFDPDRVYFGRYITNGARDLIAKYSLKKREYLSTTSMDAELALVMANMAHARSGTIFYDPFIGTGSLTVAAAHFGVAVFGSDIDPRTIRGKDGLTLRTNYSQYGFSGRDVGAIISDLVHTPLRGWHSTEQEEVHGVHRCEWLDGIICDPPYGVREGLKTLGRKGEKGKIIHYSDEGLASHLHPSYIAPRKPYSFTAILHDLLSFAAATLVPDGRLSFWMPTADDVTETLAIPMHRKLELVSVCTQPFNKWARRLITYRKRHASSCPPSPILALAGEAMGKSDVLETERLQSIDATAGAAKGEANDLNPFRKRYFQGFKDAVEASGTGTSSTITQAVPQSDDKDKHSSATLSKS